VLWLLIARAYARIVWFAATKLGIRLRGLGFACRRVSLEHVFALGDRKYFFHRPAASMYSTLVGGRSMEPETHLFFARIVPRIPAPLGFVDVGAAIGEMVIDRAGYANVARVVAFDPDPDNAAACRLSACINGFRNVEVREHVVADTARVVHSRANRGRDRHLEEIQTCLGDAYTIYRLRPDGYLDMDMRRTWNCVAVPRASMFEAACRTLLRPPHREDGAWRMPRAHRVAPFDLRWPEVPSRRWFRPTETRRRRVMSSDAGPGPASPGGEHEREMPQPRGAAGCRGRARESPRDRRVARAPGVLSRVPSRSG
jgi:hypothetical protein